MKRRIATIGFFDGVHRGHQFLIHQMLRWSVQRELEPLLITFDRHPRQVLHVDYVPHLLSTLPEKVELLHRTGVGHVEVLLFTEKMSCLSAFEFMRQVLVNQMQVDVLVMGYDHRFGHGGGTLEDYVFWGRECGIEVIAAPPFPDEKISSSLIRKYIVEGDISEATRLLGHPFYVSGRVIEGHHVGHELGFPTANMDVPSDKLLPARGVYAVRAMMQDGNENPGVLNIGERPTLHNGTDLSVEVHLLDFIGDIYSQALRVEIVQRMRDEISFSDTEQLRKQISSDCQKAKEILALR